MANDNRVGYRKPPENSQFKTGQSGNPKGRPIGTKNLKTDLNEELQKAITVREGAHPIKISKQLAIVKTLIAKTLQGDARAATTLTSMMYKVLDLGDDKAPAEEPLNASESEVLRVLSERLLEHADAATADTTAADAPATGNIIRKEKKDPNAKGGAS